MTEKPELRAKWKIETPEERAARYEKNRKRKSAIRERRARVLKLVFKGLTNQEVAVALGERPAFVSNVKRKCLPTMPPIGGTHIMMEVWTPKCNLRVINRLAATEGISVGEFVRNIATGLNDLSIDEAKRWLGKIAKPARPRKVKSPTPTSGH